MQTNIRISQHCKTTLYYLKIVTAVHCSGSFSAISVTNFIQINLKLLREGFSEI
jgi:hypothetical protein